jgi:hypothetical protein
MGSRASHSSKMRKGGVLRGTIASIFFIIIRISPRSRSSFICSSLNSVRGNDDGPSPPPDERRFVS